MQNLCITCLSTGRHLISLVKLKNILQDLNIIEIMQINGGICWECRSNMVKFHKFIEKVYLVQNTLSKLPLQFIQKQHFKSLSSLVMKTNREFDYQYAYSDPDPLKIEVNIKHEFDEDIPDSFQYIDIKEESLDHGSDSTENTAKFTLENQLNESTENTVVRGKPLAGIAVHSRAVFKHTESVIKPQSHFDNSNKEYNVKDRHYRATMNEKKLSNQTQSTEETFGHRNKLLVKKNPRRVGILKKYIIPVACLQKITNLQKYNKNEKTVEISRSNSDEKIKSEDDVSKEINTNLEQKDDTIDYEYEYLDSDFDSDSFERNTLLKSQQKESTENTPDHRKLVVKKIMLPATEKRKTVKKRTRYIYKYEVPQKCDLCDSVLSAPSSMNMHIKLKHATGKVFICDICDTRCCSKESIGKHIKKHNADPDKNKKISYCSTCNIQFKNLKGYQNHLKESFAHTTKSFACPECNKEFSSKLNRDMHHKYLHLRISKHKCEECDKIFSSAYRLKVHNYTHHGLERPRPFKCNICDKKFFTKKSLEDHARIHSDERPFMCSECGDTFKQSGALYTHRKLKHGRKKKRNDSKKSDK